MPADVIALPVRRVTRQARPTALPYEVVAIDGAVKVVIGDVELWFGADDAQRFGEDVAAIGRAAKESDRG